MAAGILGNAKTPKKIILIALIILIDLRNTQATNSKKLFIVPIGISLE